MSEYRTVLGFLWERQQSSAADTTPSPHPNPDRDPDWITHARGESPRAGDVGDTWARGETPGLPPRTSTRGDTPRR